MAPWPASSMVASNEPDAAVEFGPGVPSRNPLIGSDLTFFFPLSAVAYEPIARTAIAPEISATSVSPVRLRMRLPPLSTVLGMHYEKTAGSVSALSTLPRVGSWYTIGLCLGLGLGLSVAITGILGSNVLGIGAAAVVGAVLGGAIGLGVGDTAETIAGAIGGLLGALAAAAAVTGALRRGATRFGDGL